MAHHTVGSQSPDSNVYLMTLTDTLEGTSSGALAKHKINLHIADDTKSTEPPTGKRPGLFGWGQSHQKTLPGEEGGS